MTLQELNGAEKTGRRLVFITPNGNRWRQNGKIRRWKRDPNRVEIPVKYGLFGYDTFGAHNLAMLTLE